MATTSATIAIPSAVSSFATSVSPRDVDLEGRLDLSLDALIKERKKEHKLLKKQDEAKKQKKPLDTKKTPKQQKPQQQQKQKFIVKNDQKAQRKALVHKNRGLLTLLPGAEDRTVQDKTKTSIAATTAKLRRQIQADRAKNATSRLVFSSRPVKGVNARQQSQKRNATRQTRKFTLPTRVVQPTGGKKLQTSMLQLQEKVSVRQVMRSNSKTAKLNITIAAQTWKKKAPKKQKTDMVFVSGTSSQVLAKKASATKKVMKRATNRKAKSTQVVRKMPDQRKRH